MHLRAARACPRRSGRGLLQRGCASRLPVEVEARQCADPHAVFRRNERHVQRYRESARLERVSAAECERDTGRIGVWSDAQFEVARCANPHQPADAWQEHALIQTADEDDEFIERDGTALETRKLPLELPTELRDDRGHIDVALRPQRVDDPATEPCEPEPWTGTIDLTNEVTGLLRGEGCRRDCRDQHCGAQAPFAGREPRTDPPRSGGRELWGESQDRKSVV